jgi:hypothetical protein
MIWRYAFLDFVNDFCCLVCTFGLEIVPFGFCGLVYHKLAHVSPKTAQKRSKNPEAV